MTMPVKDEGEFELILGNKQIIAVFVIVLLLMGLFFSIGFIAGRRSASSAGAGSRAPVDIPITVDASKQPSAVAESSQPQQKPETSRPQESSEAGNEPAPAAPEPAQQKPQPAVPARLFVDQPPAGMYLQAAATQRADAEAMLSYIIGKTGLSGYVAPSPKSPELFRVLIGPLNGNEQMADARAKLTSLGVSNAFPVKY